MNFKNAFLFLAPALMLAGCSSNEQQDDTAVPDSVESAAEKTVGAAEKAGSAVDSAFEQAEKKTDAMQDKKAKAAPAQAPAKTTEAAPAADEAEQ